MMIIQCYRWPFLPKTAGPAWTDAPSATERPWTHEAFHSNKEQEDWRTDLPAAASHVTAEDLQVPALLPLSNTHTHTLLTLWWSGTDSPVMIFLIADSIACYITYCCCTFMLKSFTVHPPIYYFHECISRHCITFIDFPSARTQRQHFARVSAEPKQKAMKDKAAKTNRPNLILAHPNRAESFWLTVFKWLAVSYCAFHDDRNV